MLRPGLSATVSILAICASCTWSVAGNDEGPRGRQVNEDSSRSGEAAQDSKPVDPLEQSLTVLEQEVCGKAFAVTGSGAIWTFVPDGPPRFHEGKRVSATQPLFLGYDDDLQSITKPPAKNRIAFFDKGEWRLVPWTEPLSRRDRNGPYGRIVAGVDNTVLVVGNDTALLVRGVHVVDHGDVLGLLKKHQELIRESFGLGVPYPIRRDRWRRHTMVVADKQGRIWCLHDDNLHVLVDNQWLDCRESLIKAGSRRGSIAFIVPGPDHRYLFVGDNKHRHDGGVSFLAKIVEKEPVFEKTLHTIEGMGQYPALRERNAALWIANPEGKSGGTCDIYTGQSAIRIGPGGKVTSRLRMSGYPLLSDPIGNTWLGGIRGGPTDQLNIVHDGKIVQKLKAPIELTESFHNRDYLPVFCDSKGSVFVHSKKGLTHFVVEDGAPSRYQVAKQYAMDEKKGLPQAFSAQGYCISLVAGDDVPLKLMYLTKIP